MKLSAISLRVLGPPSTAVHLILRDGQLVSLGEGRFARVYLGALRSPTDMQPLGLGELMAVKFLKNDRTSDAVTKNATFRFCRETLESMRSRDRGLDPAVVSPVGYGRTAPLPKEDDPLLKVYEEGFMISLRSASQSTASAEIGVPRGVSVFGNRSRAAIDAIFEENARELAQSGFIAADWTGDFYALDLCLMSLEELLLTPGNPDQHSSGAALQSVGITDAPIMLQQAHDVAIAKGLQLELRSNSTGFDDLHCIVDWLGKHGCGLRESAAFRWSTLLSLWLRCAEKVQIIHSERPNQEGTGLAHRDIKPANVLVDTTPNFQVRLADLGFLSSISEILQGNFSLASSVDEGGALPRGSRGFRAPEQMQIGDELSFGQLKKGATQIELLKYLDQVISDGDWIRVQGTFKNGTSMTRLTKTQTTNVYALESPFDAPADISKGQLIPDVSLHSDVFALGCLAYFLASDGRNPERFWRQYLDEVALQALTAALPKWVVCSPLWMACVLCIDDAARIENDLTSLWEAMSSDRRLALDGDSCKTEDATEHYDLMIKSCSWRPLVAMNREAAQIARFRHGVQANAALSRLLRDRNGPNEEGAPICFPLLAIVCMCCMRDKPGSIVRRLPRGTEAGNGQHKEPGAATLRRTHVYSANESTFASIMVDIAVQVVQLPSFRSPNRSPLTDLGTLPLDQFVRARLAAPRKAMMEAPLSAIQAETPK
jgi:serine/threonine protein kinase